MSTAANQPTRQQRIDDLLEAVFAKMTATISSYSVQRHPNWVEWVRDTRTRPDNMSGEDSDLLRAIRDGLLEVCNQIDEAQAALADELRKERHERERLEERVTHLAGWMEEQAGG